MHTKHVIAGVAIAAGLSGLVGVGAAHAASDPSTQKSPGGMARSSEVDMAASQKGATTHQAAQQGKRELKFEARIKQAVKDGKITQDLADQLVAKRKELVSYRVSLKDKSPGQRHMLMTTQIDSFVSWAKAQNIPQNLWQSYAYTTTHQ